VSDEHTTQTEQEYPLEVLEENLPVIANQPMIAEEKLNEIGQEYNAIIPQLNAEGFSALERAYEHSAGLVSMIHEQAKFAQALMRVVLEYRRQRDNVLEELTVITESAKNPYMSGHAIVKRIVEEVQEDSYVGFWEQMPYAIAEAMGSEWSHMDADDLYNVLTLDLSYEDAEYMIGIGTEQVIEFRKRLLKLLDMLRLEEFPVEEAESAASDQEAAV
jgi:hypothetical protein